MKVKKVQCLEDNKISINEEVPESGRDGMISGKLYLDIGGCSHLHPQYDYDGYIYWEGYVEPSTHHGKVKILDTMIKETLRRQGWASTMYKIVEQRLKQYGIKEVSGVATRDGRNFWPQMGFEFEDPKGFGSTVIKRL